MKIDILNLNGEKTKEFKLDKNIFGIEISEAAVTKMLRLQRNSLRQGSHKAKTRAEVSGGGRKPWRQKGTGNARQGSIRAPHFRKGGVVFAKSPRDYSFKINKKEKTLALKSALSLKLKDIKLVESLKLESNKTKDGIELLKKLKLEGKTLFVSNEDVENLFLATRNLSNIKIIMADEVNVYDFIDADTIVIDEPSIKYIEEVLK